MDTPTIERPPESSEREEAPKSIRPPLSAEAMGTSEVNERSRIDRYNETLLTSSSILAGFAMTGLLGLPEVGTEGISRLGASIHVEPDAMAFTIVYHSTLLATICFLGVLVAIVSARLQGRLSGMRALRSSFRTSVLVFGVGLSALFCATITIGMPTIGGFLVGLIGGGTITLTMFVRALFLQ